MVNTLSVILSTLTSPIASGGFNHRLNLNLGGKGRWEEPVSTPIPFHVGLLLNFNSFVFQMTYIFVF